MASCRRRGIAPLLAAGAAAVVWSGAAAGIERIELAVDAIEHPEFVAQGVKLSLGDLKGGAALLTIASLRVGERRYDNLRLRCPDYRWGAQRIECRRGDVHAAGLKAAMPLKFWFSPSSQSFELNIEPEAPERWQLRSSGSGARATVELELHEARLSRAGDWLPALSKLGIQGALGGILSWHGIPGRGSAQGKLRLTGGAFSDPSGSRAAEKLGAALTFAATQQGAEWDWRAEVDWDKGGVYWQPWYVADAGVRLAARGKLDGRELRVSEAKLALRDIGEVRGEAVLGRDGWALRQARFETDALRLKPAAALFLAPLLEQAGAPKFDLAGSLRASGSAGAKGLQALDVQLDDVAMADAEGRYAASGIGGPIRWRADARSEGRLKVASAKIDKLALGAFEIPYETEGKRVSIPDVTVPVLDGRLRLQDFRADGNTGTWQWQFGGAVEPISMERLTAAVGLPPMKGSLSASIPRIAYSESTISMDGALIIQAFDGYLSAAELKVIEPFGRVPRLFGTVDMRHLDLGQLTETFSFGNITGYLDGYVKDMELVKWRPQRFDALFISAPGDYRKRISQRAVQNISALGGAGAAAAIQRSVLRVFEEFGYSKLGLSCTLRQAVCEMGGVDESPQGYVIVKGGGLPAISVIGYNRRVDWDELLARLKRVTESNVKPVVR